MAAATVRTEAKKSPAGKAMHSSEELSDQRAVGIRVNGADDVKALAQRADGARVAAEHRVTGRKALADHDDRGAPLRARRDGARSLDHARFQAGAAHLLHQWTFDRVLPGGRGVAAMHVDFRQPRERHAAELYLPEALRHPFQEALTKLESTTRKHVARADVVEERDRRRHAIGSPEAIEIDVDEGVHGEHGEEAQIVGALKAQPAVSGVLGDEKNEMVRGAKSAE
jgi:hypothetical protein